MQDLVSLKRHFRLQRLYLQRYRKIAKNFRKALGREWVQITHDAKNPLVIGDGGVNSAMTTQQKRHRGICGRVGTMAEYCDPLGDQCRKAFVINLSRNTDKNTNANLQHLWHSLKQSPIKEILSDKKHTKIAVTFDNARTYISHEFLYGCTKGIVQMFPHIKVIQWSPMVPCNGKSDLDRRFSSLTS